MLPSPRGGEGSTALPAALSWLFLVGIWRRWGPRSPKTRGEPTLCAGERCERGQQLVQVAQFDRLHQAMIESSLQTTAAVVFTAVAGQSDEQHLPHVRLFAEAP